ncbi:MAG TPA: hypothetical protein VKB48_09115 [Candidatus Acidoferrum sp.]|nr:hypothetical protein [Candidatus Acidoferrum sp.]
MRRIRTLVKNVLAVFLFATILYPSATGQTPPAPDKEAKPLEFQEEVIGEIAPGNEYKKGVVGDQHLAWVEGHSGSVIVKLDGKQQGQSYKDVADLDFNDDESRFVFFGQRSSSAWVLVVDGRENVSEHWSRSSLAFQPNGNSYAFGACQEKKRCQLVVDGRETGAVYQDISFARYSRDGKRLAYLGKKEKKWIAVVDGKELGSEMDDFWGSHWGFTRDGKHFFVAGRIKNDWMYFIDGQGGRTFDVLSPLTFSPDGQHYAYAGAAAKTGLKKQKVTGSIILDGKSIVSFEGKGMSGMLAQGLGNYMETLAEGVRDFSPDFHGVSSPEFNSNGSLVYAARREKGDVAVFVGPDAGPGFDDILSAVIFSEDADHFAYIARREKSFVEVRDNVPGRAFSLTRHEASGVPWIAMDARAAHLAFEIVSGGGQFKAGRTNRALRSVVLDGQSGPEYDSFGIRKFHFTKDAKHYHYEVVGAKGYRDLVNVDGHESRLFDFVVGTRFDSDGNKVRFIARDGQKILGVTATLEHSTWKVEKAQLSSPKSSGAPQRQARFAFL